MAESKLDSNNVQAFIDDDKGLSLPKDQANQVRVTGRFGLGEPESGQYPPGIGVGYNGLGMLDERCFKRLTDG
jgi:hypothetical protein